MLLPKEGVQLWTILAWITNTKQDLISQALDGMAPREGTVKLPRFKIRQSLKSLKGIMSKLGIQNIFSSARAELPVIKLPNLFVTDVAHSSFLEVNENGGTSLPCTEPTIEDKKFVMHVNKPFLFAVHKNRNLLHLAVMRDVTQESEKTK